MKINRFAGLFLLVCYLLGIKDGHIALWRGEDPEPIAVLPYKASMLPPEDQAALEKGIPISSREDLLRIIEDFCS